MQFDRIMVCSLGSLNRAKIPTARLNQPDTPPMRTRKVRLDIPASYPMSATPASEQISQPCQVSDHDLISQDIRTVDTHCDWLIADLDTVNQQSFTWFVVIIGFLVSFVWSD